MTAPTDPPAPKDGTAHRLTAAIAALFALGIAVALPFAAMDLARALFDEHASVFRAGFLLAFEMAAFVGCALLARYHWRRRRK